MIALSVRAEAVSRHAEWVAACEESYPKVYRALIAMGASADDAADALQDAFEQALRLREPGTSPEGWLFVAALRRWRRQRWRQRLFSPLDGLHARTRSDTPEDRIDLLVELARLTERQRTVLVARYWIGLSQVETGDLLGISAGTVGAIAHQATQRLRERMGGTR